MTNQLYVQVTFDRKFHVIYNRTTSLKKYMTLIHGDFATNYFLSSAAYSIADRDLLQPQLK